MTLDTPEERGGKIAVNPGKAYLQFWSGSGAA
jgi:hypothetical protein